MNNVINILISMNKAKNNKADSNFWKWSNSVSLKMINNLNILARGLNEAISIGINATHCSTSNEMIIDSQKISFFSGTSCKILSIILDNFLN